MFRTGMWKWLLMLTGWCAGAKKVQQDLAVPGQLERFCTPEEAQRLRRFFAGAACSLPAGMAHQRFVSNSFVLITARQSGTRNAAFAKDVQPANSPRCAGRG
jgi:hypothetical protein